MTKANSNRTVVAQLYKSLRGRLTLHSMTTIDEDGRHEYDVEWCAESGCYLFDMSGFGGDRIVRVSGPYFVSGPHIAIKETPARYISRRVRILNRTRRMNRLPRAIRGEEDHDLLDWLQRHGIEGEMVYCSICRDHIPVDSKCRHVFWRDNYGWAGSGAIDGADLTIEGAFRCLLSMMPDGFAEALRVAIAARKFHTWSVMPIIGGGGSITLHGMAHEWGRSLLDLEWSERAENAADGYHWLVSLYDADTPDANDLTLRWLDAWTAERDDDRGAVLRLADDGCPIIEARAP